jgi:DNA topoisomerase-1
MVRKIKRPDALPATEFAIAENAGRLLGCPSASSGATTKRRIGTIPGHRTNRVGARPPAVPAPRQASAAPAQHVARRMTQIELLQRTGYRRVGSPKSGFRYAGAPKRELPRLHGLRLPPAWTEVAINRNPKAKLQAIGKDKKGRWQYRYSEAAVRVREQKKYDKLVAFGRALPQMRRAIARGLRLPGLPREKVMACILRILSTCFMRPGSYVYAKENGSFGIATLQNRHASVKGTTVRFQYRGKSGKEQVQELCDRRVARIVRELKKLPGKDLFQYVAEDGAIVNIRRRHINEYIKEVMGERFSAKDFRTWAGTLIAACALARLKSEEIEGRTDRKKLIVAAIKETAAQLGNTPAVCKASYIWPSVVRSFEQGTVLKTYFKTVDELVGARSHGAETALLELLRSGRSALPVPAKRARRRETKLSRRMRRSPRARRLARAFTVH